VFWFGPLNQDEGGSNNILTRVEYLVSKKSFHGIISALEANQLLYNLPRKTYLIRFSGTAPGTFTISYVNEENKIIHTRIEVPEGRVANERIAEVITKCKYMRRPLLSKDFSFTRKYVQDHPGYVLDEYFEKDKKSE